MSSIILCLADPAAVPTDPTAYYPDFWNYASLYGEEAARAYYTTWSPPVGTQPPEGIVLPTAAAIAGSTATPGDGTGTANPENGEQAAAADQSPEVVGKSVLHQCPRTISNYLYLFLQAVAAAWEQYNRQYAEWMAAQQQAAASVGPADAAAPAAGAPADGEQPPPPPQNP